MRALMGFISFAGMVIVPAMPLHAGVRLANVFSDNMVLQQGIPIRVWGQAQPKEKITVVLGNVRAAASADSSGRWIVSFPARKAGGPFQLKAFAKDTVTLANVMVGEVWVCSGQSNMEFGIANVNNGAEEISRANFPLVRLLTVPRIQADQPVDTAPAMKWVECSPATIAAGNGGFSAVAYFFGRELVKNLNVPVGLIQSAWGGTPCETWTNVEAIAAVPELKPIMDRWEKARQTPRLSEQEYWRRENAWNRATAELYPDTLKAHEGWARPDHATNDWRQIKVPGYLDKSGIAELTNMDGVIWFRTTATIPDAWNKKDLVLKLGAIDDFDHTYFNGTFIGTTGPTAPMYWTTPRVYKVPASAVKKGKAVIAVRLFDNFRDGGLIGSCDELKLCLAADTTKSVPIAGTWMYKVESIMPDSARRPDPVGAPGNPGELYNAMIHPLIPFGIRGVIWYQGEANAGEAYRYRTLFPTMIRNWRSEWKLGEFPFLFVQLANYMGRKQDPSESEWAELREAQSMTLSLPNTGEAVIIDIGDGNDIHPKNKQDVGKRLALWALAKTYGKKVVYSGPRYQSMKIEGNRAILTFTSCGSGLSALNDSVVTGFSIAGDDKQFVWADARIAGNTVVVSSSAVTKPAAIRYAWADNPACNLYNKEGLPASPFRTDDWKGLTADK
jgi:sialate O-acetylesterase